MSSQPEDQPFSESYLQSPAYRKRLLRKLDTLIAVLDVACAKVRRSLNGPDADVERLARIQKNLKDTLKVCQRAKLALLRRERLPGNLPPILGEAAAREAFGEADSLGGARPTGAMIEMSSLDEMERFQELGPITSEEVRLVDLDELCRKLLG